MMQCARCQNTLPQGARFCPVCGFPIAAPNTSSSGASENVGSAVQGETIPALAGFAFQEFNQAFSSPSASKSDASEQAAYPSSAIPAPGQNAYPSSTTPAPGQTAYSPSAMPAPGQTTYSYPLPAVPAPPSRATPYPPVLAPALPPGQTPSPPALASGASMPVPAQPKRWGRSVGCIVLYALLAILLVFVGLGVALYAIGSHISEVNQANQAVALRLYQQVTSQTPTFQDSLTGSSLAAWSVYEHPTYGCALENDGLHVHITEKDHLAYCINQMLYFSSFAFQIQMQINGDSGGLLFRLDNTAKSFYSFEINPSIGSYRILAEKNASKDQYSTLSSGTTSEIDTRPDAPNTLTIIARGAQFDFYLNGQFLTQLQDTTFHSGYLAVMAADLGTSTEGIFTNAKIWDLDS